LRRPSSRTKWLITLAAPPVALLLLEIGLRLGGFSRPPLAVPIVVWSTEQDRQFHKTGGLHRVDLDTLWAPRAGQRIGPRDDEAINALGYRGPLLPVERTPGTLRVALVGESNVFGMYLPWAETMAPRLQALLAADGRPVEVLNAGVIGFDVCQGLERYRTLVRPHRPDVVFACFGMLNEYAPCYDLPANEKLATAHALKAGWSSWGGTWYGLVTRVRTLQLLHWLASGGGGAGTAEGSPESTAAVLAERQALLEEPMGVVGRIEWPGVRRVSLEEFDAALTALARETRADGARLILGSLPRLPDTELIAPVLTLYSSRILEVAEREGVQVLDLRTRVRDATPPLAMRDLLLDDWHFNAAGHALLAEHLAPLVLDPVLGR
jgi:lysophospholipase L1-like esterase